MPAVKRAQEKYGKQGFVVVGINADKDIQKMKDYIAKKGLHWSHYWMSDQRRATEKIFWVSGYPTNFLVGRDGVIVTRAIRLGHGDSNAQIEKALAAGKAEKK